MIERAGFWNLGGGNRLKTCSAEDLLVMKAFAGRDMDWADVTSILERQGARLDLEQVRTELEPLLAAKEAPELAAPLRLCLPTADGCLPSYSACSARTGSRREACIAG